MLPRALEVLLVALLIMATLGVAFQFQNQQLLQGILLEMRNRPSVAMTTPVTTPAPAIPSYTLPPRAVILSDAPPVETNYATPQIAAPAPQPTTNPITTATADPPAVTPTPTPAPSAHNLKITPEPIQETQPTIAEQVSLTQPTTPNPTTPTPETQTSTTPSTKPPTPKQIPVPQPITPQKVTPVGEAAWEVHGQTVQLLIKQLMTGEYDAAMTQLDDEMRQVMTRDILAQYMQSQRTKYGDMKTIIYHEYIPTELPTQYSAFDVGVETTSGIQLTFTITLDTNKQISGLYVK